MKFFLVSWSDFLSKIVKNGQILVRFSGKIGQIVSQIFANFSQILIISTLSSTPWKEFSKSIFNFSHLLIRGLIKGLSPN